MLSRLLLVLVLALTAAMLALLSVGVVFAAPSNDDTLTVTTCDSEGIELSAEEKRTFDLHNQTRSSYGLEPLCLDSALTQAAREHSQEMLDKGYFEHESYNGETTGERLKRFGYEWEVFAENIAWGTTASNSTPEYIFESWMKSSGHKANILDENLQEVGIGAHKGTSDTYSGAIVYTVDFATPTNTSGSAGAPATSEPGRTVELSHDGSPSAGTSTAAPGWCSASFDESMVRTSRNAGDQPDTDEVRRLLNEPNFEGAPNAIDDLQEGIVDRLLIEALLTIVQKHQICVNTFKTGHQFIAGVIDGPFIPK